MNRAFLFSIRNCFLLSGFCNLPVLSAFFMFCWRFLIILITGIAGSPALSQQNRIDSLKQVAQFSTQDSLRVTAMLQVAFHYIFNDSKTAWQYLTEAEEILRHNPIPYGKVNALYIKAVYYDVAGALDSSRFYFDKGYQQSREFNLPDLEVKFLNGLGMNSWNRGHYNTALDYFFNVLDVNARLNEQQRIPISTPYNNIGLIYQELSLYEKALDYHYRALDFRLKDMKLISQAATSYNNIGICLTHLKRYEEAEKAYRDGIALTRQHNFLRQYYDLIANLANTLVAMDRTQEALRLNLEILHPEKQIVLPEKFLMNINAAAAGNYVQLRQPDKALQHINAGLKLIQDKPELEFYSPDLFKFGSAAYYMKNDVDKGVEYSNRMAELLENRFSKRNAESIAEMQIKYETAEKERQILDQQLLLEQKNLALAKHRNQNIILTAALVILILSGTFYYLYYQARQQAKLQQVVIEEKEKGLEAVFHATEEERQRIAKDLHDGIGQQLSGLKMKLESLQEELPNEHLKEKTMHITTTLKEASQDVRQLSHQMMPKSLTELGLVPALHDLLQKTFEHTPVKCLFEHHQANERFDPKIELTLYRVAQELVNNVIKHAHATQVAVQVFKVKDKLRLTVEDDGRGFDTVPGNGNGHGLINIHSRINTLKGNIEYEPGGDTGTLVTITVPLN